MNRTVKGLLTLFLVFCMLSLVASVVWAEPIENPGENQTESSENTDPPSTTSKVTVTGDVSVVLVFFEDSITPALSYEAQNGSVLHFRAVSLSGYEVGGVKLNGTALVPGGDGKYSFLVNAESTTYTLQVSVAGGNSSDPTSDPSSTDDPTSDPSSTEDPSSTDDPSSTEDPTSDPSSTDDPSSSDDPNTSELRVTVNGAGTVSANGQSVAGNGGQPTVGSIRLENNVPTQVSIAPAFGYRVTAIKLDGADREPREQMQLTIDALTTLEITFEPDTVEPTQYQIVVSCETEGGYISAGSYSVTKGNTRTLNVNAGSSLTVSVHPGDGYEVEAFKVGGQAQNLSDGSFTLENIAASTTVSVRFKAVTSQVTILQADSFNWKANDNGLIWLELGSNPNIGKSVFDKINTLSDNDGEYVVLNTKYIRWYVPCGGRIEGVTDSYVHLAVALNANGSYFSTIEASIRAQDPSTVFNYYELSVAPVFPAGTEAAFHMADLASNYVDNGVDLMVKADKALVVAGQGKSNADGWTTRMSYQNSRYLVVRVQVADQYIIEASAETNGRIDPSGSNSVALKGNAPFQITANEGYIIAGVYVDNVPVAGAAALESYRYTFESVTGNHSIRATFIPKDSAYEIVNNVAVVQGDVGQTGGKSHAGLIVAVIIAFVAIAGAAALFIVKWRQEKF